MIVRNVTLSEGEKLYELVCAYRQEPVDKEVFLAHLQTALDQPGRRVVLAYNGAEAVGFADVEVRMSLCQCANVGYINDFYLKDAFRGRNIGGGMLLSVTTHLKTIGCSSVYAYCPRVNIKSQEFLEKRGFSKSQYGFWRSLK